ncbi:MAG TPA: hypothetical protein VEL76_12015 [Gemmataceae bacterium]|nr:hypothetical protein [Gemmataceae bacterium]
MDWQSVSAALVVSAAACYLGWSAWRFWAGKRRGCGGHCDCAASRANAAEERKPVLIPREDLRLRQRSSESS